MTKRTTDAPAVTRAKGSVQEAIGKLIGDDAVRAEGKAKRSEAAEPKPKAKKSRQG